MQMSVVGLGAILVSTGQAGFGVIIACMILSGKALSPFAQLSSILVRLNQIGKSYDVLKEFMGEDIEHPKNNFFLQEDALTVLLNSKMLHSHIPTKLNLS